LTLILGIALVTGVVVWVVVHPITAGRSAPIQRAEHEPTEAESRKRIALLALRDVELDYQTGKLDTGDYRELRAEAAARALAAIDAVELGDRGVGGSGPHSSGPEDLAEGLEPCRDCGYRVEPGSRFCSSCGGKLSR